MAEKKGGRHVSFSATAQISLKTSASYAVRTLIEKILYELAIQHATDAETANKSGTRNDELSHALRAIILATACMEAFINQEAIKILKQEFHAYDKGDIDIWGNLIKKARGHPSLEDKWCEITKRITNKQFDKSNQSFRGFHELVNLRNEILHYKAMSAEPVPSPWQNVPGSVTPERAKFTAKAAHNAVKSMKDMLKEFHRLTCKQLPEWVK